MPSDTVQKVHFKCLKSPVEKITLDKHVPKRDSGAVAASFTCSARWRVHLTVDQLQELRNEIDGIIVEYWENFNGET